MHTPTRPTAVAGVLITAVLALAGCGGSAAAAPGHALDGLADALVAAGTCRSTPTDQELAHSAGADKSARNVFADFTTDGHTQLRVCVHDDDPSDADVVLEAFPSRAALLARADAMVAIGARHYIWMSSAGAQQQWLIDGSDRAARDLTAIAPRFGGSKVEPDGSGGFAPDRSH